MYDVKTVICRAFLIYSLKKYQEILDIIDSKKDSDNVSRISQKEIANTLRISQTLVSKCIIRLENSDRCIEKVKSGMYKVNC